MTFFRTNKLQVFCVFIGPLNYAPTDALNVLAVKNVPGKSHWNFMSAVLRALTDNGHNVTVYTPFIDGNRINYTEVDLSSEIPLKLELNFTEILHTFTEPTIVLPIMISMARNLCDIVHEKREMREILDDGISNFDIVLVELLVSECASYIANLLNLPLIYVIPSPILTNIEYNVLGDLPNPATVSHMMAQHHAVPRTFAQRFTNLIYFAFSQFTLNQNEVSLKKNNLKPYDEIEPVKSSLVFLNTHFISEAPRPILPSVVQLGGIHLKTPKSIPDVSKNLKI